MIRNTSVRRTATRAALALALLLAATACHPSSAEKAAAGPTPTVATEPAPTTTTDPYAVPAVIDTPYVNRVLAGLDAQMGDVTRMVIQTKTIPREAYDRMRAVYGNDQRLQLAIDNFQVDMQRGFVDYRPVPGNKITKVVTLITTTRSCIFAQVSRDYSQVGVDSRTADMQWIALKPRDVARDQHGYNETGWAYAYEGYPPDRTQPANPCTS